MKLHITSWISPIKKLLVTLPFEGSISLLKYRMKSFYKEPDILAFTYVIKIEAFVISILNLIRAMKKSKGLNFDITSLSLNESKFEMIITAGNPVKMDGLGFVSASLSIRNNDLGNQSLSFTNTIKFTPIQKSEIDIYLYPKRKVKDVTENKKVSHTLKIETVFDKFRGIDDNFYSPENFIRDYEGFYKAKSADELEANNSPFKEVRELKDLFKRSTNVKVDNIATLLVLCGKAEL